MADNVNRRRSGSVTLEGTRRKNKLVEVTVDDDMTIGAFKNQIVKKLAGGRYKGDISTEQIRKSAGGVKIAMGEFHVATYANCSMKGEHSLAKMIKIVTEEEVAETKPVMENIELLMVNLDEGDDGRIVGKRIKVYWPESRKWFIGHIKAFNDKKWLRSILYDDGDKEELDIRNERFELEIMPTEAFRLKAESTSDLTELRAVVEGIIICKHLGNDGIDIECDSDVVVSWIRTRTCNKVVDALTHHGASGRDNVFSMAVNSPVSMKVGKRGSSKLRKNGTRVTRMDSIVFLHCLNNDENCAAEEPVKQKFDEEHDECKSLAEIAREGTEKLEAQAIQLGPSSEVKKNGIL
ncbi:hypothetical protein EZV62_004888 [Acer yangbiense]|uniref:RNase H type-1 domain-containing protein n=1 Tax=Acer yangbiense TaxID=1000413 RepID=A0A5C7IKY7_9ROSI|nr:hypothetical protein EZV62_004888 [Acer yangbiense]